MAWYEPAEKMELQPESDEQPAITPTQAIFHSVAAPWRPRRMFEYWRDSTRLESHFGVGYDGSVGQFVGTETRADANMHANRRADGTGAVSVETASDDQATDPWTDAQIAALIALGVWLHQRHGIPLRVCPSWDAPGFGVHRMFPEWSDGGTACPGPVRLRQFHDVVMPSIIAAATGTTPPPAPAPPAGPGPVRYRTTINGLEYGYGAHGPQVLEVGQALVRQGYGAAYQVGPDQDWRDPDTLNYQAYQQSLGYTGDAADGVPGIVTLQLLLGHLPGTPAVSLAHIIAAARTDPGAAQGHQTYGAEALVVERALADDGFLDPRWVEGSFGSRTVQAYAAFQRSLGYTGTAADGIPGRRSLERLAPGRFNVTD
ncbi:N-acetylmuramoyl-L-alanine amidase [Kitasatospora sp. NBC_00458]|uniref:N-acetylmuramoyl-L-alanine amidase n=1 Tax=Kitasatospora sp. NBC_00458 TaxID=2903568 RepID=UPI002E19DA92